MIPVNLLDSDGGTFFKECSSEVWPRGEGNDGDRNVRVSPF